MLPGTSVSKQPIDGEFDVLMEDQVPEVDSEDEEDRSRSLIRIPGSSALGPREANDDDGNADDSDDDINQVEDNSFQDD